MVNRVQHLVDELFEADRYNEYYEIEAIDETFIVSLATALAVERQLDRVPEPAWVEFIDLFGARHRVLAWHVRRITETTPATRAAWRAFRLRREAEE